MPAATAARRPWLASYPPHTPQTIGEAPYRLIGDIPRDRAVATPGKKAFTCVMPNGMSGSLSFAEVDALSDAFAAYLREELGLSLGDRVAVQIPNGLAYPVVAFGILKAGLILVNVNPLYTAPEMVKLFADADVAALVIIDMFAEKLGEALKTAPIRHIVLSGAAELFPLFRRRLIGAVQKHVRKEIPRPGFPHHRLADALKQGRRRLGRQSPERVAAYAAGLEPSAVAVLQYTGGTTGISKGAMLTHANLILNAAQFLTFAGPDLKESDNVLAALPLYHIFAFTVNLLGLFAKSSHNVLIPNPRPPSNLRKAFERESITLVPGVNTLFNALLNEPWFRDHPPRSLRIAVAGGMALQAAVAERWQTRTGSAIVEGYGLTETSPVVAFNPFGRVRLGTIGVPIPSTELKCVDENFHEVPPGEPGELACRGPQVMAGYWRRPDETAKVMRGDWLLTGDIAVMDEDGYFRIVDRRKDMILVSGFNVFPNEAEDVIAKLPGVKECAVVGVPDSASGEVPKAFIVRSDESVTSEAVRAHCKRHLTGYKVPRFVEFRSELPKSNVGKILRRDLRADPASQVAAMP
jgi:long-chain acyl-CoA synthetase